MSRTTLTSSPPTPDRLEPSIEEVTDRVDRIAPRRVLGRLVGGQPGPTLVLVAGLHGNEPAGVEAARQVVDALAERDPAGGEGGDGAVALVPDMRGEVIALAGNLGALARGQRYLERDLNRLWTDEEIERLERHGAGGPDERELLALKTEISAALERARSAGQPAFVLDLHTTSGPGPAWIILDDALPNRRFALEIPSTLVLGLEEELEGTLLYHYSGHGVVTLGFESGQHQDPASADRAAAAIWIALESAGLFDRGSLPEASEARRRLETERRDLPAVTEIRYRHGITPEDRFEMAPGFTSFQRVESGRTLAIDRRGPVLAPLPGLLLMPLYQAQGEEGFFLVRRVHPVWLRLSSLVRRLGLQHYLHLLPGVERHPEVENAFRVDRAVARWAALELFHLLGFRRRGKKDRVVTLYRRPQDRD